MNNYLNLPDIVSNDVDIVIDNQTYRELDAILDHIAQANDVEIIQKIWHGYNKCAYILSPLVIKDRFRLQLDFFVDFGVKNYPNLIRNEIMLEHRQKFRNFYIPKPEIEILFNIMRRIIKNDLNMAHVDTLQTLLKRKPDKTKSYIRKLFGEELAKSIIHTIELADVSIFDQKIDIYRCRLKAYSIKNTNLAYLIKYCTHHLRRALNRLLFPVGFSIVLLGPDGSGKSTIAKSVLGRVAGSFHGGMIEYWRPNLLPAMGKLKIWNPSEEAATNPNPHSHPRQNRIKSLIRFFYYLVDYLIGYPIKIYWAKVKKNIVVFDRYYYDYLVDLHRYRFNIPKWISRVFLPLIPSSDMVVYLDADPGLLHKRKQELSLQELQRQTLEFNKVIKWLPNSIIIKADKPIDDITAEITYLILSKKSQQTKKILKRNYRRRIWFVKSD